MNKFTLDDLEASIPDNMKLAGSDKPTLPWSKYQEDIFTAGTTTDANMSIEAVAGSGKTTTILELMRRLGTANVLFLAFNKSIQQELATRVPMGVNTATFNALGHRILTRKTNTRRVDSYKTLNILRDTLQPHVYKDLGWDLARLIGNAKHNGLGIRSTLTLDTWIDFVDASNIMFEADTDVVAGLAQHVFNICIDSAADCFDFDDQLYMPIYWDMTFPQYDVVFSDEAQDLSPIQQMQLQMLSKRGARQIAVGDSHQAIYAFRGADSKSMSRLRTLFDATLYPLSICYRCDRLIVEHAQHLVPHIRYRGGAPDGEIVHHETMPDPADFVGTSMVMCRNNAPLMSLALRFLQQRVPCYIVMDFAKDLIKLVDKMNATDTKSLAHKLQKWHEAEVRKAEEKKRYHLIALLDDKLESLLPFCDEYKFSAQVKEAINHLTRSTEGPRLSTVHKAKGLEADHAYILRPDLLPSPWALQAAERGDESALEQERNLEYVAITRAKHILHYLPPGE